MGTKQWFTRVILVPGVLATAAIIPGCVHHGYSEGVDVRVYDTDHHDYHAWDNTEVTYYSRWEGETHRDHREFKDRNADEQREYWNWRHSHG